MNHRRSYSPLALLLPLLLAALACNFQAVDGGDSVRQTDIALGVQQTMLAQTLVALSNTPTIAPTLPPATDTPSPTEVTTRPTAAATSETPTAAPETPAKTSAETATAAPSPQASSPDNIPINNVKMYNFAKLTSGCQNDSPDCWAMRMSGSGSWKTGKPVDGSLTTTDRIYVDPAWPNPALLFTHKLYLRAFTAFVQVHANDMWGPVKIYDLSTGGWSTDRIDLRPYQGENIRLQFLGQLTSFLLGSEMKIDWTVQDVRIVPDYRP